MPTAVAATTITNTYDILSCYLWFHVTSPVFGTYMFFSSAVSLKNNTLEFLKHAKCCSWKESLSLGTCSCRTWPRPYLHRGRVELGSRRGTAGEWWMSGGTWRGRIQDTDHNRSDHHLQATLDWDTFNSEIIVTAGRWVDICHVLLVNVTSRTDNWLTLGQVAVDSCKVLDTLTCVRHQMCCDLYKAVLLC